MTRSSQQEFEIGGRVLVLPFQHKHEQLGSVLIDHWWIDTRELYGQRKRSATTLNALADAFWALCQQHGTDGGEDVQESYLLAKILPKTRSYGSRHVFNDARLYPAQGSQASAKRQHVVDLENMVQRDCGAPMSRESFKERTKLVLGPPSLAPEVIRVYKQFNADFLGNARAVLCRDGADAGVQDATRRWEQARKKWGRHRGFEVEKQVLDVFSYEARAALHQCYSAVWDVLLPALVKQHCLEKFNEDFLRLWHLDQLIADGDRPEERAHLFHGHVFGLHPASGLLLQTSSGKREFGAWLVTSNRAEAFERLLHLLYLAVVYYSGLGQSINADRRAARSTTGLFLPELEDPASDPPQE